MRSLDESDKFLYTLSVPNKNTEKLNCEYMENEAKVWDLLDNSSIDLNDEVLRFDINKVTILSDASRKPTSLILDDKSTIHSNYVNFKKRVKYYTPNTEAEPVPRWPFKTEDKILSLSMSKHDFFPLLQPATLSAPANLVNCTVCYIYQLLTFEISVNINYYSI